MNGFVQPESSDPRYRYPRPEFEGDEQKHPGWDAKMAPEPDFGHATYRGTGRLQDRKTLITGADSGIGRAVTVAFAREGADVAMSYLPEEESDAEVSARAVEEAGRTALRLPGDVADENYCRSLVERTVAEFGRIDVLVNNAAYQMSFDSFEAMEPRLVRHAFDVNILAMFWLCQAALPHMPAGSSIINVSSIQAYDPTPSLLPYSTTKGAIATFTKGLAQELLEEHGIRVNAVAPGPVWTPIIPASMPAEKVAQFGTNAPMGRPAQPAELAPAFVLLASGESSFMAGEIVSVTGGRGL